MRPAADRVVVPFSLDLQPVERLFIADLLGHPVVATLEVQQLRARDGSSALRMLRMRHDGYVDVLTQDTARDLPLSAGIGRGRGTLASVPFREARFDVASGLELQVELTDPAGSVWRVTVESRAQRNRSGPFLAPVGSNVATPDRFFAVEMLGFEMLTSTARVSVEVDGRHVEVVRLPRLLTLRPTLLARWAPTVVAADLMAGPRPAVAVVPATPGLHASPCGAVGVAADGSVRSVSVGSGERSASLLLPSGMPALDRLAQGGTAAVRWVLEVAADRVAAGRLTLRREGDRVRLGLVPEVGWVPSRPTLLVRTITTLQPVMRSWPTTYRWDAELALGDTPRFTSSAWTRVARTRQAA